MGEINPRLTQVMQVFSRAQQREVDSALDRVPTVQTYQVAFDTESIQRSVLGSCDANDPLPEAVKR